MNYRVSDERVATFLTLADTLTAEVAHGIYEYVRYEVFDNTKAAV